jgi:hypothetical protein
MTVWMADLVKNLSAENVRLALALAQVESLTCQPEVLAICREAIEEDT